MKKSDWLIPAGLIALAFIPVAAGITRLVMLAGGVAITPENARFLAEPVPVALHIISVTIYCVVGAFQFSPGIRNRHWRWHRIAGRVLVPTGLVAASSGLWMALTYAIVPADNALLHSFRLLAGSGMAVSLVLGYVAIRSRKVEVHQAWMRRAYAIGQGAGTQALIMIVPSAILGVLDDMTRALLMGAAWLINLGVAEWLIRRRRQGRRLVAAAA
jgi:Predicted membrane protein (DUF2306)